MSGCAEARARREAVLLRAPGGPRPGSSPGLPPFVSAAPAAYPSFSVVS